MAIHKIISRHDVKNYNLKIYSFHMPPGKFKKIIFLIDSLVWVVPILKNESYENSLTIIKGWIIVFNFSYLNISEENSLDYLISDWFIY